MSKRIYFGRNIVTDYFNALRVAHDARKRAKNGDIISIEHRKSIPAINMGYWGFTMESATMLNLRRRDICEVVKSEFDKLEEEEQHGLTFTPGYGTGEWVERAKMWQGLLKPVLTPKQYAIAITAIIRRYAHCVRNVGGGVAV